MLTKTLTLLLAAAAASPFLATAASLPSSASSCTAIPADATAKNITKLPNPFTFLNGQAVKSKQDWTCRQEQINALMQRYELGTKPAKPSSLKASFTGNSNLTITAAEQGKSISFSVSIAYPTTGKAPYPGLIAYGGLSIPAPAGVAIITFNNDDIALENDATSRGVGKFYDLYGTDASAGATMAWAWAISRIVDALEMTPATKIKTTKLGVTGCSRNGKGALVAGAYDTRIALTIPQESGSGGSACWRLSDAEDTSNNVQTAKEIVQENVWFSPLFDPYANTSIDVLPFDHHMLAGLVSPRALYVIENDIEWLGPTSMLGCMTAAQTQWQAIGAQQLFGFGQVGNHTHCAFPAVQQGQLTAFVERALFDEVKVDPQVFESNYTFDRAEWIDWKTPRLV